MLCHSTVKTVICPLSILKILPLFKLLSQQRSLNDPMHEKAEKLSKTGVALQNSLAVSNFRVFAFDYGVFDFGSMIPGSLILRIYEF